MQPTTRRLMTEATFDTRTAPITQKQSDLETRVRSVETLGGLAPGDVSDASVANVLTTTGTSTRAALDTTTGVLLADAASKAGKALAAQLGQRLSPETTARRRALRTGAPAPLPGSALVALPTTGGLSGTGFSWQSAPIRIYDVGGQYVTDFEPAGLYPLPAGTTYYVHSGTGVNTNTGTTEAAPFATLAKAHSVAVDGDTIVVLDQKIVYRNGGWESNKITKSVRIVARHPGVKIAYADNLSYTKSAGMLWTYQAARTNVATVVDTGLPWAPDGHPYVKLSSVAAVDARPGSWFHDGTNVYIHTLDGTAPTGPRILALLSGQHFYVESTTTTPLHVYLEGLTVLGGNFGLLCNGATGELHYYARNCTYAHNTGTVEATANAATFAGVAAVYQRGCRAVSSNKDGFNYTTYNLAATQRPGLKAIEVDCEAYDHGLPGTYGDTCNASTAHAGAKVIRVNCRGHHTRGAVFADVQTGTQSVNYGCTGWDSLSSTDGSRSIFHAQQAGADMWIYGGEGFGAAWTLYAVTGAWLGHKGTNYDTTQGGGTLVQI